MEAERFGSTGPWVKRSSFYADFNVHLIQAGAKAREIYQTFISGWLAFSEKVINNSQ